MVSDAVLRIVSIANLRLMAVIDRAYAGFCLGFWGVEGVGVLPDFTIDTATVENIFGLASGAVCRKLTVNGETYLCNGLDASRIITGTTVREAGVDDAPAPTLATGAGTLTGSYTAVYTYYDSTLAFESNPVAVAPTLVALAAQGLAVTVVASSNTRFDKIRIYRNATGVPATFRLDTEISNASGTTTLTKPDSQLGAEVLYSNTKPPVAKYVAKTASRIFWGGSKPYTDGTVTVAQGSATVTFTEAPPPNFYTREPEWPFYFQIKGGPRYGVTAVSGSTATLATTYKEASGSLLSFNISGPKTRIAYADLSTSGFVKSESWNTSNKFDLGIEGDFGGRDYQEEITGIFEYANRMYVWMREGIWYFNPLITERKRTQAAIGTLSDKTVKMDKDGHWLFMGSDMQVYAFNGISTICVSDQIRNRFAEASRYNMDLIEYAFARMDRKEGLYELHRPAAGSTLLAIKYVVDVYDDYRGMWLERIPPRITAVCEVRDKTRHTQLGIDSLGLVHVVDDYEASSTYGNDKFATTTPTVFTSVAGEISPGSNKKGKVAVIFTATQVKGSKLITSTDSVNATVEDLFDPVTVSPGDQYIIGGWQGRYETGWIDFGDSEAVKSLHLIEGTFIKGSAGFMYVSWYTDEDDTTKKGQFRVTIGDERYFRRSALGRGRQIKFVLEFVSELVGCGLRELELGIRKVGNV